MTDCQTCGTPWAVVPGVLRATPGSRTKPVMARVPKSDAYGNTVGGLVTVPSSHFVRTGPDVAVSRDTDDGGPVWTYRWPCGDHEGTLTMPAYDTVRCNDCRAGSHQDYSQSGQMSGGCWCCEGATVHRFIPRDGSRKPKCHA